MVMLPVVEWLQNIVITLIYGCDNQDGHALIFWGYCHNQEFASSLAIDDYGIRIPLDKVEVGIGHCREDDLDGEDAQHYSFHTFTLPTDLMEHDRLCSKCTWGSANFISGSR